MSLKDALSIAREGSILPNISFRTPKVRAARQYLAKRFTEAEQVPITEDLEDVAERLRAASKVDGFQRLLRRDWSKAAWCLWLPGHELAKDNGFLKSYLTTIKQTNRRSLYKKLISAYLRDFDPERANIELIGQFLAQTVTKFDWVWAERQRQYQLFEPAAPKQIASQFLESEARFAELLSEIGLSGDLQNQGMAAAVFRNCLATIKKMSGNEQAPVIDRLLDWAVEDNHLRYPESANLLADALLVPWRDVTPKKAIQSKIEDFLLEHYKDPRFPTAPGTRWTAVDEETKHIFLRWLVGAALQQFLQVVDKVAMPTQWKYRKAFWLTYYNRGAIDEAWVAFAWDGQLQARKSFGTRKGFGELNGPGIQPDHAVLLMRMGDLTIADWSHNGKCHIWTASNRYAPRMYQKSYNKRTLTRSSSNKGVIHSAARHGTWQDKIAQYIAKNTGLRLTYSDYMPKRGR